MHYYKFNIGDYRRDTGHLTMLEHGAYRQLLDSYYLNEQPLPIDDAILMRTHSARSADEMQAIRNVLKDFFVCTDAGWIHNHCTRVIGEYHTKSDKAKESANARWGNKHAIPAKQDANAMRTHSEGNANHKPLTTNQHKEPSSPGKPDDGFAEFWKAYPRKVGKGAAQKAWGKIKSKADTLQAILKAIAWQRTADQWTKDGGQFIPHPSTWLNEQRWLDEAPAQAAAAIPFDRAAYDLNRKAELAASREAYKRDQAAATVPVRAAS